MCHAARYQPQRIGHVPRRLTCRQNSRRYTVRNRFREICSYAQAITLSFAWIDKIAKRHRISERVKWRDAVLPLSARDTSQHVGRARICISDLRSHAPPILRLSRNVQAERKEKAITSWNIGLSLCQPMPAPAAYSVTRACCRLSASIPAKAAAFFRSGSRNSGMGGLSRSAFPE